MKIIFISEFDWKGFECGSNLRSYEHHLNSSENKACTGFEPMTSAILAKVW